MFIKHFIRTIINIVHFSLAEAMEVSVVMQNRTSTLGNIFWDPVKFSKCNMYYVVKLYSGDELLLNDTTSNCFYSFDFTYMDLTSFRIWAAYGQRWKKKRKMTF